MTASTRLAAPEWIPSAARSGLRIRSSLLAIRCFTERYLTASVAKIQSPTPSLDANPRVTDRLIFQECFHKKLTKNWILGGGRFYYGSTRRTARAWGYGYRYNTNSHTLVTKRTNEQTNERRLRHVLNKTSERKTYLTPPRTSSPSCSGKSAPCLKNNARPTTGSIAHRSSPRSS